MPPTVLEDVLAYLNEVTFHAYKAAIVDNMAVNCVEQVHRGAVMRIADASANQVRSFRPVSPTDQHSDPSPLKFTFSSSEQSKCDGQQTKLATQ
jgi:hypothetical protein